jgi:hypothetical protein
MNFYILFLLQKRFKMSNILFTMWIQQDFCFCVLLILLNFNADLSFTVNLIYFDQFSARLNFLLIAMFNFTSVNVFTCTEVDLKLVLFILSLHIVNQLHYMV